MGAILRKHRIIQSKNNFSESVRIVGAFATQKSVKSRPYIFAAPI